MNRILTSGVLAVLLGATLFADTSHTFGPLRDSSVFRSRVAFIITMQAPVVLTEAATGSYTAACHTLRANLAAAVARSPQDYTGVFASHLVTNINVTGGGALTGAGPTLDTPATDAALLAAIAAQWSTVAGCITNP